MVTDSRHRVRNRAWWWERLPAAPSEDGVHPDLQQWTRDR